MTRSIIPMSFLSGNIEWRAIVDAIDVIFQKKTIKIINHSYIGYGRNDELEAAFERLHRAGILSIVATGNGGNKERVYAWLRLIYSSNIHMGLT